MSSSAVPNNQAIEYPSLPAVSAEDNPTNNVANEGYPITAGEASNNVIDDGVGQTPSTQRELRSSGPAPDISLGSLATDTVTLEERKRQIIQIVDGGLAEVFSSYHMNTKPEMLQIYKLLTSLVHPDKQIEDEWKDRATRAQQLLNEARERYEEPGDVPEPETGVKPGPRQQALYNLPRFVATVRRLHIEPDNPTAVAVAEATNVEITKINTENGFPEECGRFPLRYLQYNYRSANEMLRNYQESNDAEYKANATILFKNFAEATKEFCTERGLPLTWAWDCEDIGQLPQYLHGYSTENQIESISNQVDAMDLSPDMWQPTSSNSADETILHKRKVFNRVQYLVLESSGLHVWKDAADCEDVNPDQIQPILRPTRSFLRGRKRQYKGIKWIAMPVDDAITDGVGQYPPITLNVEWQDGAEDTSLWRTEVINMIGKNRVGREIQPHLPHTKMVEYEGQQAFVMASTVSGLINGEQKAIKRIQEQKTRPMRAAQLAASTSAQVGVTVPPTASVMQCRIPEPAFSQTAPAPQPASTEAASSQTGASQTAPMQSAASQSVDLNDPALQAVAQQFFQLLSQSAQRQVVQA